MLQNKKLILFFLEINLENYEKTDGSGILAEGIPNFLLQIYFRQAIKSLIVAIVHKQFSLN